MAGVESICARLHSLCAHHLVHVTIYNSGIFKCALACGQCNPGQSARYISRQEEQSGRMGAASHVASV